MKLIDHGQLDGSVETTVARLNSLGIAYDNELDGALFSIESRAERLREIVGCGLASCAWDDTSTHVLADRLLDDLRDDISRVESAVGL